MSHSAYLKNAVHPHAVHLARQAPPLLDSVRLRHGPRGIIGRFLLRAVARAAEMGIQLQFHRDFNSLAAVNEALGPRWGETLVPILHPACSRLDPAESFWISGHDRTGRVVSTQAARLLPMPSTDLAREAASLRLWFAEPEAQAARGLSCLVECPAAARITGQVVYSGAIWLDPDLRKTGVSRVLCRLTRALALAEWDCDYVLSFLKHTLVGRGVQTIYGYEHCDPRLLLRGFEGKEIDMHLIWMDRQEIVDGLQAFTTELAMGDSRLTDDVVTTVMPPARQGSIRRS